MSGAGKTLYALFLGAVGLLGLGMTLCGGVFSLRALFDILTPRQGENYALALLMVSVPSALIGAAIVWVVARRWRAMRVAP